MITIGSNAKSIMRRLDRMPAAVQGGVVKGLKRGLLLAEDHVRRNSKVKWRRGGGGLSGRLTSYARMDGRLGADAAIGFRKTSGFPYELSQEFGAKAKPGKAMAIPVTPAARRAKSPRQHPQADKLFVHATMGKAFLMRATKRAVHLEYVLVKSIPPRLHFRDSVVKSLPMIGDQIERGWKEGWKNV